MRPRDTFSGLWLAQLVRESIPEKGGQDECSQPQQVDDNELGRIFQVERMKHNKKHKNFPEQGLGSWKTMAYLS